MATEAQKKAIKKYKAKVKRLTIEFHPSEIGLLEHIEQQPKKQTYIKDLIRADMGNLHYLSFDIARLINYLLEHEDKDMALMHNAGMNEYPSTILKKLTE